MWIEIPVGKALATVEIQSVFDVKQAKKKEVRCKGCYFFRDGVQKCKIENYNCIIFICRSVFRQDHKNIIFQLVDYQPQEVIL